MPSAYSRLRVPQVSTQNHAWCAVDLEEVGGRHEHFLPRAGSISGEITAPAPARNEQLAEA